MKWWVGTGNDVDVVFGKEGVDVWMVEVGFEKVNG